MWFFYRWHPEVALRYLPIVDLINKSGYKSEILEIGSGGLGIAPYFKKKVIGVDVEFSPPYYPMLKKVKASATNLPFKNNSYKIVISVDMLEHLKKTEREKAVEEMLRVAQKKLILALPCGKMSLKEDLLLVEYNKFKKKGILYPFLAEHIENGLPEKEEIIRMILTSAEKNNKKVKIEIIGNESLRLHHFLMKGFMTTNILCDFFFRKVLLLFIPLLRLFNREPTYRKIFVVDIL